MDLGDKTSTFLQEDTTSLKLMRPRVYVRYFKTSKNSLRKMTVADPGLRYGKSSTTRDKKRMAKVEKKGRETLLLVLEGAVQSDFRHPLLR